MTTVNVKKRIMFGIYVLYCMHKLKTPFVVESLTFILLTVILTYFVSVPNVLANMFDSNNFYHYFIMAFSSTGLVVQLALILTGITLLFFVRNITVHAILKTRLA